MGTGLRGLKFARFSAAETVRAETARLLTEIDRLWWYNWERRGTNLAGPDKKASSPSSTKMLSSSLYWPTPPASTQPGYTCHVERACLASWAARQRGQAGFAELTFDFTWVTEHTGRGTDERWYLAYGMKSFSLTFGVVRPASFPVWEWARDASRDDQRSELVGEAGEQGSTPGPRDDDVALYLPGLRVFDA